MEAFRDCVRLKSLLIIFCHVRACGGTHPLGNLFISAKSQTSYWVKLIIYVIEKLAHVGYLFNAPVPLASRLLTDMKVVLHFQ